MDSSTYSYTIACTYVVIFSYIFSGDGCGSLSFQCDSGQCVSLNDYCDYKQDCQDGSDENECGICKASINLPVIERAI